MPTGRSLLHIAAIASAVLTTITSAAPFQQQHFEVVSPTTTVIPSSVAVQNSLCEYYEDIVDQVMETVTESIFASASHSFMTSLPSFVHTLGDHLTLVRSNLLASVRPLVESDLEVVLPIEKSSELALYTRVNEAVIHLNQRLAEQLGQIVNVEESSNIIISQSLALVAVLSSFFQSKEQQPVPMEEQRPRHRSIENNEAAIMTRWLHSWLSEIPGILAVEFDKRMHEAVQSVLEDFLADE
ncbi:hypothetical protein BJV82DRAFT_504432 [Fennellomyces sp. T-0311]|nr:hypothetical protein BJV82DRAFT_504432 [Fennellomyces sp. T-0311]